MAWFKKKPDPISERGRALTEEIAKLQSEIQSLSKQVEQKAESPRLRSTTVPQGGNQPMISAWPTRNAPLSGEPIFEEVDLDRLDNTGEAKAHPPEHFNELGVRKYDFPALLRRIRNHFKGPTTTNPKLVSYLAAGGIQGLRPLRYEKRVARNRFMVLVAGLFLVLLGLILVFVRNF
jgi:hypothetical protein